MDMGMIRHFSAPGVQHADHAHLVNLGLPPLLVQAICLVCLVLFYGYFWRLKGQTLGMQAWRIRLRSLKGEHITYRQVLLRCLGATRGQVAGLILGEVALLGALAGAIAELDACGFKPAVDAAWQGDPLLRAFRRWQRNANRPAKNSLGERPELYAG